MTTFNKNIDELTIEDLENLKIYQVKEDQQIEYKGTEIPRPERICATVSSFANTYGGDFYIGIEEKDGIPSEISGVKVTDIDAEELRINNILNNGVEPRIGQYKIKSFKISSEKYVILIRVQRSWLRPHRISNNQFYARKSNGKFPMDVHEIKQMFMETEGFSQRYERFKEERVLRCFESFGNQPFSLIHFLPISCFDQHFILDLNLKDKLNLKPIASAGWNPRINFNGLYSDSERSESQLQLFKNGIVEHSTIRLTREVKISLVHVQRVLIEVIYSQISNYKIMNMNDPFYVTMSLYGVKSFTLSSFYDPWNEQSALTEDRLILPEILIDPSMFKDRLLGDDITQLIAPILDSIANAFGLIKFYSE
ncbi:ATP-binding protein [Paenibacillus polymyxa]|uniref:AlbA family DNA-binding domain-containing protein n=1 Tax=Paenibacillus polymyxa TaxID=1406 RepID=UPI002ED23167|nr:ATP-binding protein [Paenibacillus polymyxa]